MAMMRSELDGDVESGGEVSSESDDDHTQACLGVQVWIGGLAG